jgi:hypothetical protein
VGNVSYCNNAEWVVTGHKRNRFPPKYDVRIQGELKDKNPKEIYKHFFDDKIYELIAQQTNICAQQKINEKTSLNKTERS